MQQAEGARRALHAADYGAVDGAEGGGVHLDDFAVVGHQAVHFAFDVGGLGVDRGGYFYRLQIYLKKP